MYLEEFNPLLSTYYLKSYIFKNKLNQLSFHSLFVFPILPKCNRYLELGVIRL